MTDDYVLYEAGTDAEEDALTHYDLTSGVSVRLLPSLAAWEEEKARLAAFTGRGRAARRARAELTLLTAWYDDPSRRERLFAEHADVTRLARDWDGETFDLTSPDDRSRFHVRLLSCLRPPASALLGTLAHAYRERFGRPLPVSSVTRTHRYQKRLRRVNRNATAVEFPPHTTGMAFDISYRFMSADEQSFLLEELARLKNAGRVEALRERLNSFHVFVFHDGRPAEDAVQAFMQLMDEERPRARTRKRGRRSRRRG
jgi:hypothetical protein